MNKGFTAWKNRPKGEDFLTAFYNRIRTSHSLAQLRSINYPCSPNVRFSYWHKNPVEPGRERKRMMQIQQKLTGEIRQISRMDWESQHTDYQKSRRLWTIIDEGDPVILILVKEGGREKELGVFDRSHALDMLGNNSWGYIKEIDKTASVPNYDALTESDLLDLILKQAENDWISLMRSTPDVYQLAVEKLKRFGLLKAVSKDSSEITQEGYDAIEMGGFDKWKEERRQRRNPQPPSINVGGHAVIGDNNSGVNQARDFLNSASPIMQNATPSEKPAESPIKKSDHTIWDKMKYISVITGGVVAVILLVAKCAGY